MSKTCTRCKASSFEGTGSWCYGCRTQYSKDYRLGKLRPKLNLCARCKSAERDAGKGYCKSCQIEYSREYANKPEVRDRQYRKLYGIGVIEYEDMLKSQNYACALCLTPQIQLLIKLSVDHCHSDGKVRGLLCHPCNTFLGLIQDDVERLKRMIGYLNGHS
jgi:hypothetical protein